jgi:protein required for attachment to host cells
MLVRVVVADAGEARFYDMSGRDGPMKEVALMQDPLSRLHDRDFKSDRPGRVTGGGGVSGGRRGAVEHHGVGHEADGPHVHEMRIFAQRIARDLEKSIQEGKINRMVLMAGPKFLGLLREALSPLARQSIALEVNKDLIHQGEVAVRAHLPADVFWS